jgi:hypothetical protein
MQVIAGLHTLKTMALVPFYREGNPERMLLIQKKAADGFLADLVEKSLVGCTTS